MDRAFAFAEKNSMCTEASYAYTGKRGSCAASRCTVGVPRGSVVGFKDVAKNSEQALMEAVMQQPVSIAIEADKPVFQLYKSGIMTGACGQKLDHGVLAVGYGTDGGQDYWRVKNSWGAAWGEGGYVRLLRGRKKAGQCGILTGPPSFPVLSAAPGPSPAPPTPAPPTPPSPGPTPHYEKPPCQRGELEAALQGSGGHLCAPECAAGMCPSDVPEGTTAHPACVLSDPTSGKQYCALECLRTASCPSGAKCAKVGGKGVCVYPEGERKSKNVLGLVSGGQALINV